MHVNPEKVAEIISRELDYMSEEDVRDFYREARAKELFIKNQNEIASLWLQVMGYGLPEYFN